MNPVLLKQFKKVFLISLEKAKVTNPLPPEEFVVSAERRNDTLDRANALVDRTMKVNLYWREVAFIENIKAALRRIEDGTFGECQRCEEPIGIMRLKARPITTLCMCCQMALESRRERKNILN